MRKATADAQRIAGWLTRNIKAQAEPRPTNAPQPDPMLHLEHDDGDDHALDHAGPALVLALFAWLKRDMRDHRNEFLRRRPARPGRYMTTSLEKPMVKTILMLTATTLVLGTTESRAQDLSETLAELHALGLQVDLRAGTAPIASAPALEPTAPATPAEEAQLRDLWDRLFNGLDNILRLNAEDTRDNILRSIRAACRLNITEDGEGFQLQFVAVSLGGVITATFTPTPQFCTQMPEDEQGR